ncbi:hypothetical protein SAMN04487930_1078 [Cytophaga hutchinsonii ATCC 33406]|jgi:hypothetical protein|nr:hypothetical protein SAMN04487930_1078 [Cytophaga hutchinsonii ATCC 33406]
MKKIALFLILAFTVGTFTDCVKSSKTCRQNVKKIKKRRKNDPHFKV